MKYVLREKPIIRLGRASDHSRLYRLLQTSSCRTTESFPGPVRERVEAVAAIVIVYETAVASLRPACVRCVSRRRKQPLAPAPHRTLLFPAPRSIYLCPPAGNANPRRDESRESFDSLKL
jgi:hypothetical protein